MVHYAPGRGGAHADRRLAGFEGVLHGEEDEETVRGTVSSTNGYAGYNRLADDRREGGAPLRLA